jgi:hypothetical protein
MILNDLYLQYVSDNFTDTSDNSDMLLAHTLNHINPIYIKSLFPIAHFNIILLCKYFLSCFVVMTYFKMLPQNPLE